MVDPPAVLLGGTENAVSVARSLARAGIDVHAVGDRTSIVRHSRALASFVDLDGDGDRQTRWLEWLAGGRLPSVILPCSDDGLELVARHYESLRALGHSPAELDPQLALAMLDKQRTYELANEIGIATPRTAAVDGVEALEAAAADIGFPCALKPRHSHLFAREARLGAKLVVVEDMQELLAWHARLAASKMLLTEIVPGGDDCLRSYWSHLDPGGETLFELTRSKLRQYPIRFGSGCYGITGWDPEVAEVGRHFVRTLGVIGFASVELKRDPRDGSLRLIECNCRFVRPTEQGRVAGVDVAHVAYERALGRPVAPLRRPRDGVRLWHPHDDLRSYREYRRLGELTFASWARSLVHRQHLAVFSWRDPLPAVVGSWETGARLPRKALRALRLRPRRVTSPGASLIG